MFLFKEWDKYCLEPLSRLPKVIWTRTADLSLEPIYVWFSALFYLILVEWLHRTKQLPFPEMTTINIVPNFQMSLKYFGNLGPKDQELTVSVWHDPPCQRSVVLSLCMYHWIALSFHISLASGTCQASSKSMRLSCIASLISTWLLSL